MTFARFYVIIGIIWNVFHDIAKLFFFLNEFDTGVYKALNTYVGNNNKKKKKNYVPTNKGLEATLIIYLKHAD